jgi:lipopolysaccharide export system permease protein
MKILYSYIGKKFVINFFMIMAMLIAIIIVFDIAEKLDDFIKNKPSVFEIVFHYYFNMIPYFINLFSPLLIFIAAIYFTSRMAANTEFVAMLTSGINFYRLLVPYFMVAVLFSGFSWYLNSWVIPETNKREQAFELKYILNKITNTDNHIHRQIEPGVFIYMQSYDVQDSFGYKFTLEKMKDNKLTSKLEAQSIEWNNSRQEWKVTAYSIRTLDSNSEKYEKGNQMWLKLPITPTDFGRKTMSIQTMNNRELKEYIKQEKLRGETMVSFYEVEKYYRFAMPFATFILVMIAFSISSRKIRGGTGLHLAFGIRIAFTYILCMKFSTVFATKANMNAFVAVWIPNFIFTILTIILLIRPPK